MITNVNELTPLEAIVLRDLAHGLTTIQIAKDRTLSVPFVERCVNELYAKVGATSRQNLIAKAFVRGFLDEAAFEVALSASVVPSQRRPAGCFP